MTVDNHHMPLNVGLIFHKHNADTPTERIGAVEPTCTESGCTGDLCYMPCSVPIEKGTSVPAHGHSYDEAVTAPTCTENGYTTYTCTRCGDSYTTDETLATGHSFGNWTTTAPPTEYAEGNEERVCTGCGVKETRTVPKLPATELTLNKTSVTLLYKSSETLTASEAVTWTSSNEKAVKLDANGKLTTVGSGTAVITAHSVQGGKTATCTVTVKYAWWQWLILIFLLGFIWY